MAQAHRSPNGAGLSHQVRDDEERPPRPLASVPYLFSLERMHRLPRKDLEMIIGVAMKTAPKLIRRRIESRDPFEAERGEREMVEYICGKIDNDSYMVIVAELVGECASQRRGKFGVEEPMPATVPSFSRPPTGE